MGGSGGESPSPMQNRKTSAQGAGIPWFPIYLNCSSIAQDPGNQYPDFFALDAWSGADFADKIFQGELQQVMDKISPTLTIMGPLFRTGHFGLRITTLRA